MKQSLGARLARGLWVVAMVLAAIHLTLQILARHVRASPGFGFPGFDAILTVIFASVGALVATRQSRNPIGWICLAVGLESGIQGVGLAYALNGILGPRAPWPGAAMGAWLNAWFWFPAIMAVTLVFHVFPTGRFLSPRWRAPAVISIVAVVVGSAGLALTPGPLENFAATDNPFGVNHPAITAIGNIGFIFSNLLIVLAVASLIVRYRRSGTTVRAQIKWVAYAGVTVAIVIPVGDFFGSAYKVIDALVLLSIMSIPLSIVIAILRYRLYDIDRIISRTMTYAVVVGLLACAYVGLVVVFQEASRPLTGGSDLAVAASTLIVAAAFVPLLRRVRDVVDRRFNRHRYDAQRTVELFSARLRDETDIDKLTDELREVVRRTMQPTIVSLWLRTP